MITTIPTRAASAESSLQVRLRLTQIDRKTAGKFSEQIWDNLYDSHSEIGIKRSNAEKGDIKCLTEKETKAAVLKDAPKVAVLNLENRRNPDRMQYQINLPSVR